MKELGHVWLQNNYWTLNAIVIRILLLFLIWFRKGCLYTTFWSFMRFQRNSCSKCFFPIGMKGKITGKSCRPNYMHKHETLPSCRTPSFYSGKRDQTDQPNGGSIAQHRFYTACYIENCKDFFPADSLANSEPICN